jgi:hypothetical protein
MKRDKGKQIIKECSLLFIASYIDWVIQGERRALLRDIVPEDVVDFIMTYFAAITLFYSFRLLSLYKKEELIKKSKVKILFRFIIAGFLVLLWETLIYLVYSTFYYQEPLSETSFFYNGVPMIILILGFLAIYFYASHYNITDQRSSISPPSHTLKELIVSKGDSRIVISEQDFGYFFTKDKLVWLSTWQGSVYVVDHTLSRLEGLLDSSQFFRVNRQLILCRRVIQGYSPSTNQKIQVDFIKNERTAIEDVTISKYNAPKFKKWISNAEKGVPSM